MNEANTYSNFETEKPKKQIPASEIEIIFSRSSGAGGQNVNKTSTKAQARWSVMDSEAFEDGEKLKIIEKYENSPFLNNENILMASCQETRSQPENSNRAVKRLQELVDQALVIQKERIATTPTYSSKLKRIDEKTRISNKKILRQKPHYDDY